MPTNDQHFELAMRAKAAAAEYVPCRRLCPKHVGDVAVQPAWADSPEEMRVSSTRGVQYAIDNPNASPEDQHKAWARDKIAAGWKYGPVKDEAAKTHPALVDYNALPEGTRRKDALFRAVVAALR